MGIKLYSCVLKIKNMVFLKNTQSSQAVFDCNKKLELEIALDDICLLGVLYIFPHKGRCAIAMVAMDNQDIQATRHGDIKQLG